MVLESLKPSLVLPTFLACMLAEPIVPTSKEDALIAAAMWAIKIVGGAAGVVLIMYTKRIMKKLEAALDFFETAPKDAWGSLRKANEEIRRLRLQVQKLSGEDK